MRTEIGSEFWSVPLIERENGLFPQDTKWFVSGRAALLYIIRDIKSKRNCNSVSLPSWCCGTMILPFLQNDIKVSFYPVTVEDHRLKVDCSSFDSDILFVMDYFGYETKTDIPNDYDGIVIRDTTHSVFRSSQCNDADYDYGSLRKWAGFWTGGYANARHWAADAPIPAVDDAYLAIRMNAMRQKENYICDRAECKEYLSVFEEGEDFLDHCGIQSSVPADIDKAKHLNVDFIRTARRQNAMQLLDAVGELAIFPELSQEDCPLFVPILVPEGKRDALKKHLIENEIYCPTHWPIEEVHSLTDETRYIYDNEISLVCDQRYGAEDMLREVDYICNFLHG